MTLIKHDRQECYPNLVPIPKKKKNKCAVKHQHIQDQAKDHLNLCLASMLLLVFFTMPDIL